MLIFSNIKSPRLLALLVTGCVMLIVLIGAAALFINLPDAHLFNDRVAQIFSENDALTTTEMIKLLEIMAQSGSAFESVLNSYRLIIFILLLLTGALFLSTLYFLLSNTFLSRQIFEIEQAGLVIKSLTINREEHTVHINNHSFDLTQSTCESLSVLCEARLDDEIISGIDIEAMITGKPATKCEEAAGATRIKRLRDYLGNQLISQLLIRNVSRRGYMLSIEKNIIKIL